MPDNTQKLISFYEACQNQQYTDMTDERQSLKAKVIAMDLDLDFHDIGALYESAKKAYLAEQKRQQEAQVLAEKRAVDGTLYMTVVGQHGRENIVKLYRRPDQSFYYTWGDNSNKKEGLPSFALKSSATYSATIKPGEAIYTGATVGGITTGGVHYTKPTVSEHTHETGKGYIEIKNERRNDSFRISLVRFEPFLCEKFHRDALFQKYCDDGKMLCLNTDTELSDLMLKEAVHSGRDDQYKMMGMASRALDMVCFSYMSCKEMYDVLQRAANWQFPPSDEELYQQAKDAAARATTSDELQKAIPLFEQIRDYRDSAECIQTLKERLVMQKDKDHAVKEARSKKRKKGGTIIGIVAAVLAVLCLIGYGVWAKVIVPSRQYDAAQQLFDAGKYEEARQAFSALKGFRDSREKAAAAKEILLDRQYEWAVSLAEDNDFDAAIQTMEELKGYKDSQEKIAAYAEAKKAMQYEKASEHMQQGRPNEAAKIFKDLGNYRDSQDMLTECTYLEALDFYKRKFYTTAETLLNRLKGYKDADMWLARTKLYQVDEGGLMTFGSYEQDNDLSNGKEPIKWRLLKKDGDKRLLLSYQGLDCQPFHSSDSDVTWEKSSLRQWLNGTFYREAFSDEERKMILQTTVEAEKIRNWQWIDPGPDTKDRVFLLCASEAQELAARNKSYMRCEPTRYAKTKDVHNYEKTCNWWLRAPGNEQNRIGYVGTDGGITWTGATVDKKTIAVRPAIWIQLP